MVEVVRSKLVEGTSKKSGKPYKAYVVYYTEDDDSVFGVITGDAFIDVSLLNGRVPMPGDKMELNYNKNGFLSKVAFA